MKRGTIMMIFGLAMQIINWIYSSFLSNLNNINSDTIHTKSALGYVSIVGWLVFFAGLGVRQLDKKIIIGRLGEKAIK